MANLQLAVKTEYFNQIKAKTKLEENRLYNDYWRRRLIDNDGNAKVFDNVIITLGYPKRGDTEKTLIFPWRSWIIKDINHPHFGKDDVTVFAIQLKEQK